MQKTINFNDGKNLFVPGKRKKQRKKKMTTGGNLHQNIIDGPLKLDDYSFDTTQYARHIPCVSHSQEKDDMTLHNKNIMPRNNLLSHLLNFSPFRFHLKTREISAHI